jgi:hypothetical protein
MVATYSKWQGMLHHFACIVTSHESKLCWGKLSQTCCWSFLRFLEPWCLNYVDLFRAIELIGCISSIFVEEMLLPPCSKPSTPNKRMNVHKCGQYIYSIQCSNVKCAQCGHYMGVWCFEGRRVYKSIRICVQFYGLRSAEAQIMDPV